MSSTKTGLSVSILAAFLCSVTVSVADTFDTDGDGFDDNTDNCTLTANPNQRDTDGDYMGNMCDADFNNDMTINSADLAFMRANFFSDNPDADLNGDRVVNFLDLSQMSALFFGSRTDRCRSAAATVHMLFFR